jgi:hypothetical protein
VSGTPPCALALEGPGAPSASPECGSEPWSKLLRFTQPARWSDSNADGWWEAVLEIRLDPRSCGCARLRVAFEDKISGWTVHVGDSPTNNGHGGDEGTTSSSAEVQLAGGQLTVYSAAQFVRRQVDKLLDVTVPPLAGRTMDLDICDQSVAVEILPSHEPPCPLKWKLETLSSKLLFALGPGNEGGAGESGGSIYVAFNRVIHLVTGAASHERVGSGVRRVEISLSP